jgi:hypothetical protein
VKGNGPWHVSNLGKRHLQALDNNFMTDITVHVNGTEKFRCHVVFLSLASPTLTEMIRDSPHELKIPDVKPCHFKVLLQ